MRSKLQTYVAECLSKHLPGCQIIEDAWPEWLRQSAGRRLQLDFYIPEMKIAIEVQGEQHYRFTPHWHPTREHFDDAQKRDELKRQACACQGVQLLAIDDGIDVMQVVTELARLWEMGQAPYKSGKSAQKLAQQRQRGHRRKKYRIYLHDRSKVFKVSGKFFKDVIQKQNLVVQLDAYTAVARPEFVLWRNQWFGNEAGAVVFRRRSLDEQKESAYSSPQAE